MLRRRQVAGSPARSASDTWATIAALITDTLAQAKHIAGADVAAALAAAEPGARMLVAAGHLATEPLTLVAGNVYCQITTVTGAAALALEEDRSAVPGITDATTFTLHLPAPSPLAGVIADCVAADEHLSDTAPEATTPQSARAGAGPVIKGLIDLKALRNSQVKH